MIGNYTAHKLLTNFQKFDLQVVLLKRYKPKDNLYNLINDDLKKLQMVLLEKIFIGT